MGTSTKHHVLALLGATALALSACGAQAAAPEPSSPTDKTASASALPTADPTQGPLAVPVNTQMLEPVPGFEQSVADRQGVIGQAYITAMVENQYSLSGQWTADGNDHANTAKLWSNYFSQDLQDKLTSAGSTGDVTGFANWAAFALAPPDSTDAIKASPTCAASESGTCAFKSQGADGSFMTIGEASMLDLTVPNRVAYDRQVAVPVSLTAHGNAEGVMTGILKVDLTFVPNPNPGPGKPEFLINSVNNKLEGPTADLLSNHPELLPM